MIPRLLVTALLLLLSAAYLRAYPIDGYEQTGIRRLERTRLNIESGRSALPSGARNSLADIRLNLADSAGLENEAFPAPDPALQKRLESLFPDRHESYSVALLDLRQEGPPRFAAYQADRTFSPGSVGKLAIAAGLFNELRNLFPDDPEARQSLLRTRKIGAGKWILGDHHEVPLYTPEDSSFVSRPIQEGDVFSLYEWTDHMLSASANSAASTVWKEIMLMRAFAQNYPPSPEQEEAFFRTTSKAELGRMALSVVNDPLRASGIAEQDWRLGSFFTGTGQRMVPSGGGSHASPRGLLLFLMRLEQGRVVDAWSSLEIKRLLYMTAKRIRYASSPALSK
ncbi:MAG: hypothetical protein O2954_11970, partial [bacterium]|nr:hypothetical protein [bacterium]